MHKVLALGLALLIGGCGSTPMIRSVDRTQGDIFDPAARDARAAYLGDYALPRSRFTVTVSSPASTPAAAVTPPTVANTITVTTTTTTTGGAGADTKDAKPDLATWCRTQRESYNTHQRTIANARGRREALVTRYDETFNTWLDDEEAEDQEQVDEAEDPDRYEEDVADPLPVILSAAEKADWRTLLLAELSHLIEADAARHQNLSAQDMLGLTCPQPLRVVITETIERDPTRIFSLYADHDNAASDQLTLALDANGFITNLSGTSTDRTGDAVVGAVKTLVAVSTFVNPFELPSDAIGIDDVVVTAVRRPCSVAGSAVARAERVRQRLRWVQDVDQDTIACVLALLAVPDDTVEIDLALPRDITFTIPTSTEQETASLRLPIDFAPVETLGLSGSIECAIGRRHRDETLVGEGLATSTPTPCEIVVTRGSAELARANTWSLDSTRTVLLEVPRSPFVTQASGYTFANGRQTGANWNRPSPAEQVVTLPVRMIGAVVEGVAAGVTGQRGRTEAETAQINAETARLQALAALEEARAAREDKNDE